MTTNSEVPSPIVGLTVEEPAGVGRRAEFLLTGVPFPRGRLSDASSLGLLDEQRRPVPSHVTTVNRWWDDGSIKWVHFQFPVDVPARGRRELVVVDGTPKGTIASSLQVAEDDDRITIVTGPLKFTVKKRGFTGIGEAWLDPAGAGEFVERHRVIGPHSGGLLMRAGGVEFHSRHDAGGSVIVEGATPLSVVLKAIGTLTAPDGRSGFAYTCRLTAYAGQARVAAQVSVANTMGPERGDCVSLEALIWEQPTVLRAPRAVIGGERETHQATLAAGESASIYQHSSDAYTLGGVLSGSGSGKSVKPLTTGWGSLSHAGRGLAAGMRWFWQTYPKAIELRGDGALRLELYPPQHAPLDLYTGVSRTHDLLFLFHDGGAAPEELRDAFAAFQQPLRAFAPLQWYCRDTQAFGTLVEADPTLYGERWTAVERYLAWWTANFENILLLREERDLRGIARDAYGWLEFGDSLHWVWQPGNPDPRNLAWDGNYYDFPHACLLHFLLTGRRDFFDAFIEHGRHLADVHFVHFDPEPAFIGSNRYCPPTDHVRVDPVGGDFQAAKVYVSNTFNHHKTESLFETYFLTGDRRALDVALMGLRYAHDYRGADDAYNQPRGPGNQLLTLVMGYELTGDRKYLDRCRRIVEFGRAAQAQHEGDFNTVTSSRFQFGIALEGLRRYYEATGDATVPPMIRMSLEFLMAHDLRFTNCADASGFLFATTGEARFLEHGLQVIGGERLFGNPAKDTALNLRNAPRFLPYLAK